VAPAAVALAAGAGSDASSTAKAAQEIMLDASCLHLPPTRIYYTPHPIGVSEDTAVAHTIEDKTRLLQRVRRLRGQVDAIERALERDADCARVMQLTVSARGAANGLMAELLEDHIRMHVSDPARDRDRGRARGAKHLIDIVHAYLR
jgi:DNA-binding FrmR family transcriptional regulator